jgi:hypothetical protein
MVVSAAISGLIALVVMGWAILLLLWLHRNRKLSDVTGTVVARDRQFTGRGHWTYPVVEFTTQDGTQIRRVFRQTARPAIGRKLRIVYDPNTLPDGRKRTVSGGLTLVSRPPMIYSVWLLLWLWLLAAAGLAALVLCIAIAAGAAAH